MYRLGIIGGSPARCRARDTTSVYHETLLVLRLKSITGGIEPPPPLITKYEYRNEACAGITVLQGTFIAGRPEDNKAVKSMA